MRWFAYALALIVNCAAADAQVVAFGASAVLGWGVAPAQSYPAQLERMLRAKGMNVTVINAGVYDDTSEGMLARLDTAIPQGTRVVILDTSGEVFNDSRRGVSPAQSQANIATMEARLAARRIAVTGGDIGFADELSVAGSHPPIRRR